MEETYQQFIERIIDTRGRHGCGDEYHERHHILPRCLGGKDEEENYIDLFAKEHFEAHRLLAKENPYNKKLQYAWWCMSNVKKPGQERYKCTAEEYEEARITIGKVMSDREVSEETKKKMSNSQKGKHLSDITKDRMSEAKKGEKNYFYGKHHTEETKNKISEALIGREIPEEVKNKIGEALKGHEGYWKGKHHSEEAKEKLRKIRTGFKASLEDKKKMSKPILCIETKKEYYGALEAQRQTGIRQTHICECCKGKRKTAGGYHWQYIENR